MFQGVCYGYATVDSEEGFVVAVVEGCEADGGEGFIGGFGW